MSRVDHLVDAPNKGIICPCGCFDVASRFMRCRKCGRVIARCTASTNGNMERVRDSHEELCT